MAKSLEDACERLATDPSAVLLAGGTDFMVEVNYNRRRVTSVVCLSRLEALKGWQRKDGRVEIGAAMTYTQMEDPFFAACVPLLAQAARTVGSPQIRNAGTLGGNLATASPAGDAIPPLAALDARIKVVSVRGEREVDLSELIVGAKTTTLARDEIITRISIQECNGPAEFLKVGVRNAMVISTASVALAVDRTNHRVKVALGSVAAAPLRARNAEDWISELLDWESPGSTTQEVFEQFGDAVAAATSPITDHRSSAQYRRRAVKIMARRALARALS